MRQFHQTFIDDNYYHWRRPRSVLLAGLYQRKQSVIQLAHVLTPAFFFYQFSLSSFGSGLLGVCCKSQEGPLVHDNLFSFVITTSISLLLFTLSLLHLQTSQRLKFQDIRKVQGQFCVILIFVCQDQPATGCNNSENPHFQVISD